MATRYDLICLGEAMGEFNATGEAGEGYRFGHGGDTSNCAVAAARQGLSVAYASAVGDDLAGRSLLAMWRAEGVSTDLVTVDPARPTGLYFISHGPEGHAFSYRREGSPASLYGPTDLPREALAKAHIVHASGISQAISSSACDAVFEAFAIAREAGALVSFDTNLRLRLWPLPRARALIMAAAAMADIVLPGHDDAAALTGMRDPDAICDAFLALGCKIVALTLGAEGSLVATHNGRERIARIPVSAIDATGAGDAYDGAFLAEYLRTGDAFAAGRYANVAAALSTEAYGAIPAIPRRAAVEARLRAEAGR